MQKDKRSGSLVGQEVLTNTTLLPRAGHEDKLNMAQKLGAELSRFCSLIVLDFWQNGFFAVAVEEVPENTDVEKQNEFKSVKSQFLGGFFQPAWDRAAGAFGSFHAKRIVRDQWVAESSYMSNLTGINIVSSPRGLYSL